MVLYVDMHQYMNINSLVVNYIYHISSNTARVSKAKVNLPIQLNRLYRLIILILALSFDLNPGDYGPWN